MKNLKEKKKTRLEPRILGNKNTMKFLNENYLNSRLKYKIMLCRPSKNWNFTRVGAILFGKKNLVGPKLGISCDF